MRAAWKGAAWPLGVAGNAGSRVLGAQRSNSPGQGLPRALSECSGTAAPLKCGEVLGVGGECQGPAQWIRVIQRGDGVGEEKDLFINIRLD